MSSSIESSSSSSSSVSFKIPGKSLLFTDACYYNNMHSEDDLIVKIDNITTKWFGSFGHHAIVYTEAQELKKMFIVVPKIIRKYPGIPPHFLIAGTIHIKKPNSWDMLYDLNWLEQFNFPHLKLSIYHELTWNSFRMDPSVNKVEITIRCDPKNTITMDLDLFIKYRIFQMHLMWMKGQMCFACDWEYYEDNKQKPNPDKPYYKHWSTYEHYDKSTNEWSPSFTFNQYKLPLCQFSSRINTDFNKDDEYQYPMPLPNLHHFTWIPLYCLLLELDGIKPVQFNDNNPKHLCLSNLTLTNQKEDQTVITLKHFKQKENRFAYCIMKGREKLKQFSYSMKYYESKHLRFKARYEAIDYILDSKQPHGLYVPDDDGSYKPPPEVPKEKEEEELKSSS
jgi:hypothetical protein